MLIQVMLCKFFLILCHLFVCCLYCRTLPLCSQSLPALILKIMRGTIGSIAEHYSEELGELILSTLHLDPNKRPSINQHMATPIVMNAILNLYTDFGMVPCRRYFPLQYTESLVILSQGGASDVHITYRCTHI